MTRFPPRREVVATADCVKAGLLRLRGLVEELRCREPLVAERYAIRNLLRLALAGPEDAADGFDHTHRLGALPTGGPENLKPPPVDVAALTLESPFARSKELRAVQDATLTENSDRGGRAVDPVANAGTQVEWHLAREQGDAYGDALQLATELAAGASEERRTEDYWITYLLDSPRRIYSWVEGMPRWQEPEGANLYVGIAVRDATDGRFIPAMSVGVTLVDEAGRVVGAGEQSLVWDPLAHQYGRNWEVQGAGPHSMRVRIEPPDRIHSDQAAVSEAMRPVEVEFSGLKLILAGLPHGTPGSGAPLPEQHQL